MKFTTPCFIRVEDAEKREELFRWLAHLGYAVCDWRWRDCIRIIRCWTTPKGTSKAVGYPCKQVRKTDIDCGTDIELFKALAAMNNENDHEQWFVVDHIGGLDEMVYADSEEALAYIQSGDGYRKATTEEIIERFRWTRN